MNKSIGRYIQLQGGFAFKSSDFKESGVPLIRISNVTENGLNKSDAVFLPIEYSIEFKDFLVEEHDTLIAMSGATTGKCCLIKAHDLPCLINQRVGRFIIINQNEVDKLFVFHVVNSPEFKNELLKDAFGSAQPNVSPKDIEKVNWSFPSFPIQTKIAKILSTADSVIEKTQAAIAKYKAIKQGMLQDLFTRGIDTTTNQLRPRFEDAPHLYKVSKLGMIPNEWGVDVLGNIISVSSGEGLSQENIEPGIHLIYGGNGINGSHSDFLFEDAKLIIGRVGEYCGNAYITEPFSWVTDNALVVTPLRKDFLMDFWQYYLNFLDLNSLAFVGAQPVITGGLINKVVVKEIPDDEQRLFAERLTAIDNKLQTEQTYLQKMQLLKKGLMEDLLSGKKQVKVSEPLTVNV